jgi:hypothetical protein
MPKRKAQKPANKAEPKKRGRKYKEADRAPLDSKGYGSLIEVELPKLKVGSKADIKIPCLEELLDSIEVTRQKVLSDNPISYGCTIYAGNMIASVKAMWVKHLVKEMRDCNDHRELIARAIYLGKLSVEMALHPKERAYEVGKSVIGTQKVSGLSREKIWEAIEKFRGQKSVASKAAKYCKVHLSTFYKRMKEEQIQVR